VGLVKSNSASRLTKQAPLFFAVASVFIIDNQELRPDYNEMGFTALTVLFNTTSGIPNQFGIPVSSGPKVSAVQARSILFTSPVGALERVRRKVGSQDSWSFTEDIVNLRERHGMLQLVCWKLTAVMDQVSR